MTIPRVFRVSGRDIHTLNPDRWASVVGQVGGIFAAITGAWRWIAMSTPANLAAQRQRLQHERDLLTDPTRRQTRLASYLQLQDLEHAGHLHQIEHTLAIWPDDEQQRDTLADLLHGPLGSVTPLSHWPSFFDGASYQEQGQVLLAEDHSHAWRCLLSGPLVGSVLPTFFQQALAQPVPVIVVVDVKSLPAHDSRRQMELAQQRLEANAALYRGYDEARRQAQQDWAVASDLLYSHGALLHRVQIALLVQGESPAAAIHNGQRVAQTLGHVASLRGMDGSQAATAQFTQPIPTAEIAAPQRPHTMVTHQLAALLPWGLSTDLRQDGLLLGLDEQRRVPVIRDPHRLIAGHAFISGATGSGKTSYVVTLAHRMLEHYGTQIIAIDPQGAMGALAAAHPGSSSNRLSFLPMGDTPPLQLNLLDPITDDLDLGLVEQVTHVEQVIGWLAGAPLTTPQAIRLRQALTAIYGSLKGMPLDNPRTIPRLSDLLVLLDRQGADPTGLRDILVQWTLEPLCRVFDRPTSLDLRLDDATPVILYDLSDPDLPERYRRFFTTMLCAAIQRAIRRRPRERIVILDEAGVLFNDPQFASFAETFAKTLRRFKGWLWLIDQTLELLTTHAGREVFQNSFITVLGMLKSDQAPLLRTLFPMLTDHQIQTTIGMELTEDEIAERAGHYTLIMNNQVSTIYNHLSSAERGLLPQQAVAVQAASKP